MLHKTNAIVLYKQPWKESSFIVSLMSEDFGVFKAIIQGARKEKSRFFAQFELGYQLEILL